MVAGGGSPPLTRGIHLARYVHQYDTRFTPAHAGNTEQQQPPIMGGWVHPRSRGEYFRNRMATWNSGGSPPLTRGILTIHVFLLRLCGFTPAHAGNTQIQHFWYMRTQVHPRSRGEYNQAFRFGRDRLGSPPLTRGIPLVSIIFTCLPGFTPAHAGNTHSPYLISCLIGVHPRSRGEYLCYIYYLTMV